MTDTDAHAPDPLTPHIAAGTTTQPQRVILAETDDMDDAQASGEWVSATALVDVRR